MTKEQRAAYITAQAAVLFAEVSGMVAENTYRQARGETIAYCEDAFQKVINESGCCQSAVIRFFRN